MRYGELKRQIQKLLRDETTATGYLIDDMVNQYLEDIGNKVPFPELQRELTISYAGASTHDFDEITQPLAASVLTITSVTVGDGGNIIIYGIDSTTGRLASETIAINDNGTIAGTTSFSEISRIRQTLATNAVITVKDASGVLLATLPATTVEVNNDKKTYNILDIRDPDGAGTMLTILPLVIFDKAQVKQDNSTGYPRIARILDDHTLVVWPYGSSTTWYSKIRLDHPTVLTSSDELLMAPDGLSTVRNGVLAELMLYKDDSRYGNYQSKYEKGLRDLNAKYIHPEGLDMRMQSGTPNYRNSSWERIFGDYING